MPSGLVSSRATPRARTITGSEPNCRCIGPAMFSAMP